MRDKWVYCETFNGNQDSTGSTPTADVWMGSRTTTIALKHQPSHDIKDTPSFYYLKRKMCEYVVLFPVSVHCQVTS